METPVTAPNNNFCNLNSTSTHYASSNFVALISWWNCSVQGKKSYHVKSGHMLLSIIDHRLIGNTAKVIYLVFHTIEKCDTDCRQNKRKCFSPVFCSTQTLGKPSMRRSYRLLLSRVLPSVSLRVCAWFNVTWMHSNCVHEFSPLKVHC